MPKGANPKAFAKPFKPPTAHKTPKPMGGYIPPTSTRPPAPVPEEEDDEPIPIGGTPGPSRLATPTAPFKPIKPIAASSFYAPKGKTPAPAGEKIVIGEKSNKDRLAWGGALHDPGAVGAVVMTRPSDAAARKK